MLIYIFFGFLFSYIISLYNMASNVPNIKIRKTPVMFFPSVSYLLPVISPDWHLWLHSFSYTKFCQFWLASQLVLVVEPACQWRRPKRHGFCPWVRKIPWRRKWQRTPVFLPGESHGQRSLAGSSLEFAKSWELLKWLSTACTLKYILKLTKFSWISLLVYAINITHLHYYIKHFYQSYSFYPVPHSQFSTKHPG